jgi:N utilization substance protein B
MPSRRAGRELALKVLFQVDVGKIPPQEALALSAQSAPWHPETLQFARELVEGTVACCQHLDAVISRYARQWTLDRMASVDRNVLRLALYEILFRPEVPHGAAVDEAVELAKKYSTAESGKFVNGILGQLLRDMEAGKITAPGAAPDQQK